MYEDIVSSLRGAPDDWYDANLHYEAANAILDLSRKLEYLQKYIPFLVSHGVIEYELEMDSNNTKEDCSDTTGRT